MKLVSRLLYTSLSILLLFINIKEFAIPYFLLFSLLISWFLYQRKINEIVIAFTFFGFSFFSLYCQIIGTSSILLILILMLTILLYRFFTNWKPFGKYPLKLTPFFLFLFLFICLILLSFSKTIFTIEYQDFKIQLFLIWSLIFILSANCLDNNVLEFDFEVFLIIAYLLFIPHFSIISDEGGVLSPIANWNKYSVLADGIRGTKGVDVISAGRYSGLFILTFVIYFIDFKFKKLFFLPFVIPAFILLIIVQTRQAFVALLLPIVGVIIYYLFIVKSSGNRLIVNLLSIIILCSGIFWYANYINENHVETRVLASKETSGREKVWNDAKTLIVNDETGVGFGNFIFYGKAYSWPHNIFFETIIEIGWPAFFLLLLISGYLFYEIILIVLHKPNLDKVQVFMLFTALYYFILSQFSADIPRNLHFFYALSLYILLKGKKTVYGK